METVQMVLQQEIQNMTSRTRVHFLLLLDKSLKTMLKLCNTAKKKVVGDCSTIICFFSLINIQI